MLGGNKTCPLEWKFGFWEALNVVSKLTEAFLYYIMEYFSHPQAMSFVWSLTMQRALSCSLGLKLSWNAGFCLSFSWEDIQHRTRCRIDLSLPGKSVFCPFFFNSHFNTLELRLCLKSNPLSSWKMFCYLRFHQIQHEFFTFFWRKRFRKRITVLRSLYLFFYVALHAFNSAPGALKLASECRHYYPLNAVDKGTLLTSPCTCLLSHLIPLQMEITSHWYLLVWRQKVLVIRAPSQLKCLFGHDCLEKP